MANELTGEMTEGAGAPGGERLRELRRAAGRTQLWVEAEADLFRQRRRWSLGAVQTVARVGWQPHTRVYWRQQAMLLLAVCSMSPSSS